MFQYVFNKHVYTAIYADFYIQMNSTSESEQHLIAKDGQGVPTIIYAIIIHVDSWAAKHLIPMTCLCDTNGLMLVNLYCNMFFRFAEPRELTFLCNVIVPHTFFTYSQTTLKLHRIMLG